jgi:hypothetical protein
MERTAKKLAVGFESFKIINQPKTDVNLRFSTSNMQRLAAALDPAEQDEFLLLWKPQPGRTRSAAAAAAASVPGAAPRMGLTAGGKKEGAGLAGFAESGGVIKAGPAEPSSISFSRLTCGNASGSSSDAELVSSDCECDAASSSSPRGARPVKHHGAKLSPEAEEEVRKMRAIPVEWRAFHICLGAFLYCTQFKMPVPAAVLPITKPEVARWLGIKPADQVITHHFTLYK